MNNYKLLPFQETTVNGDESISKIGLSNLIISSINKTQASGKKGAILIAPTGAGKTIIMSNVIKNVLNKEEKIIILWVSYIPQLNIQSKIKLDSILSNQSDILSTIVSTESDFMDIMVQKPQKIVAFLNPQKISKSSNLMNDSETGHLFTDILFELKKDDYKIVIMLDEAHLGSGSNESETIISNILTGEYETSRGAVKGLIPDFIIGMTATEGQFKERLQKSIAKNLQIKKEMAKSFIQIEQIPVSTVKEAKLIKQTIYSSIYEDLNEEAKDEPRIDEGIKKFIEIEKRWAEYNQKYETNVCPLLIVQVGNEKDRDKEITDNNEKKEITHQIEYIIKKYEELTKEVLSKDAVKHCFSDNSTNEESGCNFDIVEYIEPSSVEKTIKVKILFFKSALSAGWDCPRAEVLISIRPINNKDTIKQIQGRLIRNPLITQIDETAYNDLNAVHIYQSRYNQQAFKEVLGEINLENENFIEILDSKSSELIDVQLEIAPALASIIQRVKTVRRKNVKNNIYKKFNSNNKFVSSYSKLQSLIMLEDDSIDKTYKKILKNFEIKIESFISDGCENEDFINNLSNEFTYSSLRIDAEIESKSKIIKSVIEKSEVNLSYLEHAIPEKLQLVLANYGLSTMDSFINILYNIIEKYEDQINIVIETLKSKFNSGPQSLATDLLLLTLLEGKSKDGLSKGQHLSDLLGDTIRNIIKNEQTSHYSDTEDQSSDVFEEINLLMGNDKNSKDNNFYAKSTKDKFSLLPSMKSLYYRMENDIKYPLTGKLNKLEQSTILSLENDVNCLAWFRNKEKMQFAIEYADSFGKKHLFYPDFIAFYKIDKEIKICIIESKGNTDPNRILKVEASIKFRNENKEIFGHPIFVVDVNGSSKIIKLIDKENEKILKDLLS